MIPLFRPILLSACLAGTLSAATVQIIPDADTYLAENFPTNNNGGSVDFVAGTVNNGSRARALLRFNVAGALPQGARVTSAALQFEVLRLTMGAANSTFELRRVHLPWQELNTAGPDGPVEDGATWLRRLGPDIGWIEPGALLGIETAALPSGTLPVAGTNVYTLASTPEMVADVQYWLDHPGHNHGWMLRTQSEQVNATSRRIASREDAARAPRLIIEWEAAADPFRITAFELTDDQLTLAWSGSHPDYQVQWSPHPGAPWETLAPLTDEHSMILTVAGDQGYYRVGQSETALYEMTFDATWSSATHPTNYPGNAHWSGFAGGLHNDQVRFFREGETASEGVQLLAERGNGSVMDTEVNDAISAGTASASIFGDGLAAGTGQVRFTLQGELTRDHPLVTLITMVAPSPDWFAGVESLSLIQNGRWVDRITLALLPWDAGTDSGASYASPDEVTLPRGVVTQLDPHPTRVNGLLIPFGTMTFERVE